VDQEAPYGWCPICGSPGVARTRSMDGPDICAKHHSYPKIQAVKDAAQAESLRKAYSR
jgi:hypothetical protein